MKKERRKFIRFDIPLKADVNVQFSTSSVSFCGAKDFSRKGLRLVVHGVSLSKGLVAVVNVYLPGNDKPILVKGKVAWAKDNKGELEAGLTIEDIDKGKKSDILDYVYGEWRKKNRRNSKWISPPD